MRKNIHGIATDLGRMNIAARLQNEEIYNASVHEAKAEGALPDDYDVTYDEMKAVLMVSACWRTVIPRRGAL